MTTPEEQKSSSITLHSRSISVSTIIKIVIKFGATAIGAAAEHSWLPFSSQETNGNYAVTNLQRQINHWTTPQRHKSINCWVYLEMQPVSTTAVAMVLMHSPTYLHTYRKPTLTAPRKPSVQPWRLFIFGAVHDIHCSSRLWLVYATYRGCVDCRPYLGWKRRWQHFFLFLRITGGRALCNLIYSIFNNTPLIRYGFISSHVRTYCHHGGSQAGQGRREGWEWSFVVLILS